MPIGDIYYHKCWTGVYGQATMLSENEWPKEVQAWETESRKKEKEELDRMNEEKRKACTSSSSSRKENYYRILEGSCDEYNIPQELITEVKEWCKEQLSKSPYTAYEEKCNRYLAKFPKEIEPTSSSNYVDPAATSEGQALLDSVNKSKQAIDPNLSITEKAALAGEALDNAENDPYFNQGTTDSEDSDDSTFNWKYDEGLDMDNAVPFGSDAWINSDT